MSDGWSCRVVSGSSIGGSGSAVSCCNWMAGGGHTVRRGLWQEDVCTVYTLYAGGCLRSISSVSPWYPLVGIPNGVHSPHSARLDHPSRLKIGTLAAPLPAVMDILAESKLTFRHCNVNVILMWALARVYVGGIKIILMLVA